MAGVFQTDAFQTNAFQQTGTCGPVQIECRRDDHFCDFILCQYIPFASWRVANLFPFYDRSHAKPQSAAFTDC